MVDTTALSVNYNIQNIFNTFLAFNSAESRPVQDDVIDETGLQNVITGPNVQFEIEECNFDELTARLIEFEREYGHSSLEIFSQYIRGETLDENLEEWLDLVFLYLGTREIRQFSCP